MSLWAFLTSSLILPVFQRIAPSSDLSHSFNSRSFPNTLDFQPPWRERLDLSPMSTPSSPAVPAHPAFEKQDKATMNSEKAASAPAMLQYAKLESNPMAREHGGAASVYDVHQPDHVEKRAVRRRLRWLAFLFPAVCILATLSIQQHGCDGLSFSGNFFTGLGGQSSAIPAWTEALPPATTLAVDPRFSKRQEDNSTSTSSNSSSTSGSPPAETNLPNPLDETPSATVPVTAQPLPTVPNNPVLPTPFPQAFDSSITQAFKSDSCFNFFSNMTSSAAFRTCRPFSLLLQTSNTFLSVSISSSSSKPLWSREEKKKAKMP